MIYDMPCVYQLCSHQKKQRRQTLVDGLTVGVGIVRASSSGLEKELKAFLVVCAKCSSVMLPSSIQKYTGYDSTQACKK